MPILIINFFLVNYPTEMPITIKKSGKYRLINEKVLVAALQKRSSPSWSLESIVIGKNKTTVCVTVALLPWFLAQYVL